MIQLSVALLFLLVTITLGQTTLAAVTPESPFPSHSLYLTETASPTPAANSFVVFRKPVSSLSTNVFYSINVVR